jgi:hypothetical protein
MVGEKWGAGKAIQGEREKISFSIAEMAYSPSN